MEQTFYIRFAKGLLLVLLTAILNAHIVRAADVSPASASTSINNSAVAETGIASYYADKHHGRLTANGETFDMHGLTAAHRTLPFGTKLKVTSLANNRSVVVCINDRGPFVKGRIIDLSLGAAKELQMVRSGLAEVKLEIIK